jgi:hypothetical protein
MTFSVTVPLDSNAQRFLSLESIRQDVKYTLRGFRREPAMTLIAIIILALAMGANTAVFSIAMRALRAE